MTLEEVMERHIDSYRRSESEEREKGHPEIAGNFVRMRMALQIALAEAKAPPATVRAEIGGKLGRRG